MRIAWLTDIHLNFLDTAALKRFLGSVSSRNADAVLVAGDIGEADTLQYYLDSLLQVCMVPIYFVLGNHDYYRGSIGSVRSELARFLKVRPQLVWLTNSGIVSLTATTALIGHDSWGDGRLGDYWGSTVQLSDFFLIKELTGHTKQQRLDIMMALADEAAHHFEQLLPEVLKTHQQIFILTHVPPFAGATWHQGRISDSDWMPFFSAKVVGDVLKAIAESYPGKEILVLCGHTHSGGTYQASRNLKVITGAARYGHPEVQGEIELK